MIMDTEALLWHIQAYSGIMKTLCDSCIFKPCHVPISGIFRTQGIFKTHKTWTGYIENPAIVRTVYSGTIQSYSYVFGTLCNADIWNICQYPEPFHNCILIDI